jgi:hypothetical protein
VSLAEMRGSIGIYHAALHSVRYVGEGFAIYSVVLHKLLLACHEHEVSCQLLAVVKVLVSFVL